MKSFKLSLAAFVAISAFSNLSAAPLEDAIKDIDVSGFGRYRYDSAHYKAKGQDMTLPHPTKKDADGEPLEVKSYSDAFHRFTLDVNFKATLDDNFFTFIGVRYDTRDISGRGYNENSGISNTHGGLTGINAAHGNGWGSAKGDSLSIRQYYAGYKGIPDTTILAGRQIIGAFFTDDIVGTGLKVVNNSIEGLSLAAMVFDNIEDDGDLAPFTMGKKWKIGDIFDENLEDRSYISQNNLYGVAAIYSYEWLSAQAWYAHLQNVAHLWAVDLSANYAINDEFSLRGRVNVAGSHFTKSFHAKHHDIGWDDTSMVIESVEKESMLSNSTFVGVNLGATYSYFSVDAGYISFGKKGKIGAHTLEDEGKFIKSGEYALDYTTFSGKHDVWYGKIALNYDAYSLGLDYTHDKAKGVMPNLDADSAPDIKATTNAWTLRAGYKYSDKLSFNAWWENISTKYSGEDGSGKIKSDRVRFDAKYNF